MKLHFGFSRKESERGVSTLEAALIVPVFVLFFYVIFEIARFFTYQAVLNASAQRALSLATVIPDLDNDLPALRDKAENDIKAEATTIPLATFFSLPTVPSVAQLRTAPVTLTYTQPTAGQSRVQVLTDNPISVTVTANIQPLFTFARRFFGNTMTFVGTARGFREPRNTFSQPQALDCNGVANGGNVTNCRCPATNDPAVRFDPSTSQCTCVDTAMTYDPATTTCKCPTDWRAQGGTCVCDITGMTCKGRRGAYGEEVYLRPGSCVCESCWGPLSVSADGTSCGCPAPGTAGKPTVADCAATNSYYDTHWWCACKSCGTLANGAPNAAGDGCDCTTDPCPNNSQRQSWNNCVCSCDLGVIMTAPTNGQISCAPPACASSSCTWQPGTNEWTVDE